MAIPPVVSAEEWQQARDELLIAEKDATRALDAIAARRRRLPMVAFGAYTFTATSGSVTLRDLFGEHNQLMVYQFMDIGARCAPAIRTSPTSDARRTGKTHPMGRRSSPPRLTRVHRRTPQSSSATRPARLA